MGVVGRLLCPCFSSSSAAPTMQPPVVSPFAAPAAQATAEPSGALAEDVFFNPLVLDDQETIAFSTETRYRWARGWP